MTVATHVYTVNAWLCYLDNGRLDKYYMLTLTMICLSMAVKNDDQRKEWAAAEQIEEISDVDVIDEMMWQWALIVKASLSCFWG